MTHSVEARELLQSDVPLLLKLEAAGKFALRKSDARECFALGLTPIKAIKESVEESLASYVILVDDEIVALWGYGTRNMMNGIAYPWCLTTPALEKHKVYFARGSIAAKRYLLSQFVRLEVLVDAHYLAAQNWLEWLGFSKHPNAILMGPNNSPFIFMWAERK